MNILDELSNYINSDNQYNILAKVVRHNSDFGELTDLNTVENKVTTVDCIGVNGTYYTRVRIGASTYKGNKTIPALNSWVMLGLLDQDNAIIINVASPHKYNVQTWNEKNEVKANLNKAINDFSKGFNIFQENLIKNIKDATYSYPCGVTSHTPINVSEFEKTSENINDSLNEFKKNIDNLFY